MTYEQAREDHEYLWNMYGPAVDMTGGYVDQDDLKKLLMNPTKATARQAYENQINYWFRVGPDRGDSFSDGPVTESSEIALDDSRVRFIAERYHIW